MQRILKVIAERPKGKPFVVAIDGRSGAGKSTLAARVAAECGAALLHVDDFYLPLAVRTEEMMQQPAGHIDTERLLNEVLLPLMRGRPAACRRFDCRSQTLQPAVNIPPAEVIILEGSYSCCPALWQAADLHCFVTVDAETQRRRISGREGERAEAFFTQWIPLEERYFAVCGIEEACDVVLTSK